MLLHDGRGERLKTRQIGGRWRELAWRSRHVYRRAMEAVASGLILAAIRTRTYRRLPRKSLAFLERALIAASDYPIFDAGRYLELNPDVRDAGVDPLTHYLADGWAEGRDPNGWLDERRYRRQAGLGPGDRISAIGHYLAYGRMQGLGPSSAGGLRGDQRRAPLDGPVREGPRETPGEAAARVIAMLARLESLRPRSASLGDSVVDVIVPVYGGRAETLTCLASVLRARNETAFTVVVVDDRGPDPALRTDLGRLAERGLIELVVQPQNSGFVASTNAGMRQHPDRDVIWLNSDTEVFDGWIDRLRAVATSVPDVATVTPLTNNGTICSYPRFDADNVDPLEIGWDEVDRVAADVNAGRTVDSPTCVGFCTYVRRAAIDAVGPLDEEAFGQGYGEENDFSRRAVRAGLRNLIAGNVFVYHVGQTSFGDERGARVAAALKVVERRHPGYRHAVRRFLADDPVAPLRRAIDVARLARPLRRRRNVLLVTHSLGGGTRQHVAEEVDRLTREGAGVVVLSGGTAGQDSLRLSHRDVAPLPSLSGLPFGGRGFAELIRALRITELHLHHLADFGRGGAERFSWLVDGLNLPFDFVVHDYLAVCPRINLADIAGMYCGEPGEAGCRRCLIRRRSQFGAPDIRRWRREYGRLLGMARYVRVPDRDVAERLRRYFPRLGNVVVRPHERLAQRARQILPAGRHSRAQMAGRPLRIATIGAIGPIKGFDVLLGLAGEIRARRAAVELTVIGYTRNDQTATAAGIEVTGRYENARAAEAIAEADPDLILIASTWPETYCYTLSHALESGRPVAGFDIGAVGTRLRDAGRSGALPLALARDPAALLDALIELAQPGAGLSDAYGAVHLELSAS